MVNLDKIGNAFLGLAAVNPQYANLLQNKLNAEREAEFQQQQAQEKRDLLAKQDIMQKQKVMQQQGANNLLETPTFQMADPTKKMQMLMQYTDLPAQEAIGLVSGLSKLQPKDIKRDYTADVTGIKRYTDTGEQVFPDSKVITPEEQQQKKLDELRAVEDVKNEKALEYEIEKQEKLGKSSNEALMTALVDRGVSNISEFKEKIFNKDGTLDLTTVAQIQAGVNLTPKARKLNTMIANALGAKIRIETGAVISKSEVDEEARKFMVGILDEPESARFKLNELDTILKETQQGMKPITQRNITTPKVTSYEDYFK